MYYNIIILNIINQKINDKVISQNNGYPTPNKYESCSYNDSEKEDRYETIS